MASLTETTRSTASPTWTGRQERRQGAAGGGEADRGAGGWGLDVGDSVSSRWRSADTPSARFWDGERRFDVARLPQAHARDDLGRSASCASRRQGT